MEVEQGRIMVGQQKKSSPFLHQDHDKMNAGRQMRKWNFGFKIRMLGEHFAVILRKSTII